MLPSPGTICGDITDTVFGNKTIMTKRGLEHGDLIIEEQLLEVGKVLSQAGLTHPFRRSLTTDGEIF